MNKFYEFHNGIIVRLDKVLSVIPPHFDSITNRHILSFGVIYDATNESRLYIKKEISWIKYIQEKRQDIYDKINMYNAYGDFHAKWIWEEEQLELYKQNEYADFVKAWKEYNE